MATFYRDFRFLSSCEIALDVKVYIGYVDAVKLAAGEVDPADLLVSAQIIDSGIEMHEPVFTLNFPHLINDSPHWDEWISLPIKFCDLSRNAQVVRFSGLLQVIVRFTMITGNQSIWN